MKFFSALFLFFGLTSFGAFAQESPIEELPTATIADDYYVTLDPEIPIQDFYRAEISHLGFTSQSEGQNLLNIYVNGNLIDATLNLAEGYAIIHIHTEFFPTESEVTHDQIQNYLDHLTKPE